MRIREGRYCQLNAPSLLLCRRTKERKLEPSSKESNKVFFICIKHVILLIHFYWILSVSLFVLFRSRFAFIFEVSLSLSHSISLMSVSSSKLLNLQCISHGITSHSFYELTLIQGETITDRKHYNKIRCEYDEHFMWFCL